MVVMAVVVAVVMAVAMAVVVVVAMAVVMVVVMAVVWRWCDAARRFMLHPFPPCKPAYLAHPHLIAQ